MGNREIDTFAAVATKNILVKAVLMASSLNFSQNGVALSLRTADMSCYFSIVVMIVYAAGVHHVPPLA
jgi:hypothetical protein